jgi:hypothetical protein
MKKIILLTGMLGAMINVNAQTGESVLFDNYTSPVNNDLKNKFTGNYTFSQVNSGGITGGAIALTGNYEVTNYNLQGWAIFKDTFDINAQNIIATLCFKYVPTTNQSYIPATIKIQTVGVDPSSMSEFLNIYYEYDGTNAGSLNVSSISHTSSTAINDDLITGHWYKLEVGTQKNLPGGPTEVGFSASLQDIGIAGADSQVVATMTDEFNLSDFYNQNYDIMVGITGNLSGGASYLDNFYVDGTPTGGQTGIKETGIHDNISMPTLVNNVLPVTINGLTESVSYIISDVSGKVISTGKLNGNTNIMVNEIAPGNYFASFFCNGSKMVKRFIKK